MYGSHLLVAVVDTEAGRNAARQAVRLAVSSGSRLSAISVVPALEGDVDRLHVGNVMEAMEAPHKGALEMAESLAREAGVAVETRLRHGQPHEQIVDQADALDAEVVVLGQTNRNAIGRALTGPTASRVIGYSRADALVVPEGAQIGFDRILLALDGSENSRPAARRALELAEQYGSRITALSVVQIHAEHSVLEPYVSELLGRAKDATEDFLVLAGERGCSATSRVVQDGDVAGAITRQAGEVDADLIVMGSHGRTGLRRLLMGSVAENVLARAQCPVLIVH